MCDAMHFAEEMTGRFRGDRKALPAVSISDPSHLSCVANDYGFDFVFSRFIDAHGKKGDVLLAISTSGNSKNVLLDHRPHSGRNCVCCSRRIDGQSAVIADPLLSAFVSRLVMNGHP